MFNTNLGAKLVARSKELFGKLESIATSIRPDRAPEQEIFRWRVAGGLLTALLKAVIIEDSSQAKLPKANAETFPAHGNDKGETAGC